MTTQYKTIPVGSSRSISNGMKKLLISGSIAVWLLPFVAMGAFNDVTLTTDAIISVNSISLTVSGSSATIESIVVGSTSFTVTLQPSSSIVVTSSNSNTLFSTNAGAPIRGITCGSTPKLTLTSSALSDISVIVSPTSDTCVTASATVAASSSGGGSGGIVGGGGGGGSSAPLTAPSITQTAVTKTTANTQSLTSQTAPFAFTKSLNVGARGNDVLELQKRLVAEGLLKATPTGYFGQLTLNAVKAFQAKNNLSQVGAVGPATRALLNASASTQAVSATTQMFAFSKYLEKGSRGNDVIELQNRLKTEGLFEGDATGYFGSITEAAVKAYQEKNGISALGIVGPATRAALNK